MSNKGNNKQDHFLELVSNLTSQSNESSNLVLNAISQGITNGLSQGIASGTISVSFQDVLSLASMFKSNNDISLRILDHILPNITDNQVSTPTRSKQESSACSVTTRRDQVDAVKGLFANPTSHGDNPDSLGLLSSVHVFDVTDEEIPALEHTVSHRVSENADDHNTISSSLSSSNGSSSTKGLSDETDSSIQSSNKQNFNSISEDNLSTRASTRPRIENHTEAGTIESIQDLSDYVSVSPQCVLLKAAKSANKKLRKNHGESIGTCVKQHCFLIHH
jgi:hypothetical protein